METAEIERAEIERADVKNGMILIEIC